MISIFKSKCFFYINSRLNFFKQLGDVAFFDLITSCLNRPAAGVAQYHNQFSTHHMTTVFNTCKNVIIDDISGFRRKSEQAKTDSGHFAPESGQADRLPFQIPQRSSG